jgi:hypothetical protein
MSHFGTITRAKSGSRTRLAQNVAQTNMYNYDNDD